MEGSKDNPVKLDEVIINSGIRLDLECAKAKFFPKGLSAAQVDSIDYILKECNNHLVSKEQAAYIFATVIHETAHTMLPIKERGGDKYLSKYDTGALAKALGNTPQADGDGQLYAGRGYVQLTGRANYSKFSKILGVDFIKSPDLVMRADYAAFILVYGMMNGTFTGRKLSQYINKDKTDFYEARRVVNRLDKASLIKEYAEKFLSCIG